MFLSHNTHQILHSLLLNLRPIFPRIHFIVTKHFLSLFQTVIDGLLNMFNGRHRVTYLDCTYVNISLHLSNPLICSMTLLSNAVR
jgi:hypothetical protein